MDIFICIIKILGKIRFFFFFPEKQKSIKPSSGEKEFWFKDSCSAFAPDPLNSIQSLSVSTNIFLLLRHCSEISVGKILKSLLTLSPTITLEF